MMMSQSCANDPVLQTDFHAERPTIARRWLRRLFTRSLLAGSLVVFFERSRPGSAGSHLGAVAESGGFFGQRLQITEELRCIRSEGRVRRSEARHVGLHEMPLERVIIGVAKYVAKASESVQVLEADIADGGRPETRHRRLETLQQASMPFCALEGIPKMVRDSQEEVFGGIVPLVEVVAVKDEIP